MLLVGLLGLLLCSQISAAGLRDNPVVGSNLTYLDGSWRLYSNTAKLSLSATVPGDMITDFERVGLIGDPYFERSWRNSTLWDLHVWTYEKNFTVSDEVMDALEGKRVDDVVNDLLLVFDGIKMAATISLNNVPLQQAADQFLRYTLTLGLTHRQSNNKLLKRGLAANTLSVTFDPLQTCDGRYMACTGGWDWAPYSDTWQEANPGKAHTFSKGIWKSVYLVGVDSVAITHVVPHVYYTGSFPTSPLSNSQHAPFNVHVTTHFWSPVDTWGNMQIQGTWGSAAGGFVNIPAGESNVTFIVPAEAGQVELWWPAGLGNHTLYNVSVTFQPGDADATTISTTRRIGFRFFAVVTGNITDPAYVTANANTDGTDNLGMYFHVNGVPIYSRGANMIPMEELEGRYNSEAHKLLVQSAVEANMNTLRVWGGGVFLPDVFYDTCDEVGILIYHDMQFAQDGHSPLQTQTQEAEFRHQIRRLSHHPSIAIWDGCNECQVVIGTDTGIYATFVLTVVMQEDKSRVLWPSCPSHGWTSGVNRLSALPNGSPLGLVPVVGETHNSDAVKSPKACTYYMNTDVDIDYGQNDAAATPDDCCSLCEAKSGCTSGVYYNGHCYYKYGGSAIANPNRTLCVPSGIPPPPFSFETHGPYQHGAGFNCVNGDATLDLFPANIPITLDPNTVFGVGQQNVFASEFGCSVFSSFESMSPTLKQEHWGIHAGLPADQCEGGFEKFCVGENPMSQRNYPCDNIIQVYFGASNFDAVGQFIFQQHLYQCMIGQALEMKADIETRRGQNQFGCLVWQFNEIWPTGGWGSVEYGTPVSGQVLGGRWKPLHYWYRKSLFRNVMATCGDSGVCYLRNDFYLPFNGSIVVSSVALLTGANTTLYSSGVTLPAGPGAVQWFKIIPPESTSNVLVFVIRDAAGDVVSENLVPLTVPGTMNLPKANVVATVASAVNPNGAVNVTVTTDNVAMYVVLTTLAYGRFSDNAFLLVPPSRVIEFIPMGGPVDVNTLKSTLRTEHVALYR